MNSLRTLLLVTAITFAAPARPVPHPFWFRPTPVLTRREILLDHAPAAKVISFLQSQYRNVQFIPHSTLNGFYAIGSKREVLQICAEIPNLDKEPVLPKPPIREFYQVKYADIEEVSSLLRTMVPDVKMEIIEHTMTLSLEGDPRAIEQAKDLLDQIDRPLDQIMLAAQVIASTPAQDKGYDIDWSAEPPAYTQSFQFADHLNGSYPFTGFSRSEPLPVVPRVGRLRSKQLDTNINYLITSSETRALAAPESPLRTALRPRYTSVISFR